MNVVFALSAPVLLLLAIVRFGVLGLAAFIFFFAALVLLPPTFERSSIYFAVGAFTFVLLVAIAAYGFYISTAGRSFNLARLLDGD
jgi:ABC-type transport system involved in cytochrome c biogenesis permease subunit